MCVSSRDASLRAIKNLPSNKEPARNSRRGGPEIGVGQSTRRCSVSLLLVFLLVALHVALGLGLGRAFFIGEGNGAQSDEEHHGHCCHHKLLHLSIPPVWMIIEQGEAPRRPPTLIKLPSDVNEELSL